MYPPVEQQNTVGSKRSERRSSGASDRGPPLRNNVIGLRNLGNTCYMNLIIQCLYNTQEFSKSLIEDPINNFANPSGQSKGGVAGAVKEAFKQLQSSPGNPVSLDGLKSTLGCLLEPFQGSRQQDSHEFLMKLMEWLREDLAAPVPYSDLNSLGVPDDSALHPDGTSEFERIFYGLHRATIRCGACSHMSTSFETFTAVSLSFPSEGAPSLKRLITNHYADSPIEYRCTRCERLTLSTRTFCIWKMPSILILHLNKFNNITGLRVQNKTDMMITGDIIT